MVIRNLKAGKYHDKVYLFMEICARLSSLWLMGGGEQVEAPKNAASALLEASLGEDIPPPLGEDKYDGQKSEKPDKLGICASSKGVGNTWQQVFCRCGRG